MILLKRPQTWISTMMVMILLLAGCATMDQPAVVVNPETTDGQDTATITDTTTVTENVGNDVATGTNGVGNAANVLVTASSITDYNFENIDGEVTGSIQDVLIDVSNGNIPYVTVEYGGFLDIGDTELPMPLNAFVWGQNGELVLNFDETQLENFPDLGTGWPNTTDANWDNDVANFWNGIGLGNNTDFAATDSIVFADDLIGFNISDIGAGANTIDDLLIDLGQSQVNYVVMDAVATAGVNEVIAVPFDAFDVTATGNLLTFREGIDSAAIENAPRFNRNDLMAGNPQLYTDTNTYWGGLGYGNNLGVNDGQIAQDNTVVSEEQGLTVGDTVGIAGTENMLVRASTLLDYNTTDLNGESIGEIEDILIDVQTGGILYATLEYGGFLDIGDREVPIPLSALSWVSENELMLNLDEQQLENLPDLGTNWPDVTDATWNDEINTYWTDNGFDVGYGATGSQTIMYASNLIDADLGDAGFGANGSVEDLLIDLSQSQATWVVVNYGDLFGNDLVPVPFSAIDVSMVDNGFGFTPNIDLTTFEGAPRIDSASFDQAGLVDSTFDDDIVTYWEDAGYTVGVNQNMTQ
ncbi:MAG TPA: PRC-barrel domain-containing protein [Caldilineaceae bacterium]|nr:PRC-barrel domain-containing protein [Caldilineaceae bacterium]